MNPKRQVAGVAVVAPMTAATEAMAAAKAGAQGTEEIVLEKATGPRALPQTEPQITAQQRDNPRIKALVHAAL